MRLRHQQRGISLIELMVGMVVGLLVLASAFVVYLTGSRASTDSVRVNRFNQDVREIVNIMASDIRRAGYTANVDPGTINTFTLDANNLRISGSCILYSYDASFLQVGGVANPKNVANPGVDFFGFRRNNNTLQILNPAANVGSTAAAVCTTNENWLDLTDPSQISITSLTFDTEGSRCLAYIKDTFKPDDDTTYEDWAVAAGVSTNPCTTGPAGGALPDITTHHFVESRQIQISLTASHPSDAQINRAIGNNAVRETVLIRNNRVLAP